MFKCVPDQLRVSDGWVRCGQCDEVFDANQHLQPDESIKAAPVRTPVASSRAPKSAGYDWGPELTGDARQESARESPPPAHPDTDPFLDRSPHELWEGPAATGAAVANAPELEEDLRVDPSPELDRAANPAQPRYVQANTGFVDLVAEPKLSFVQPVRQPRPQSPWYGRWGMRGLAVVLAGGLLVQFAVNERSALSAQYPAAKPWLAELCSLADCVIEPVRRIEQLAIDSSSFVKVQPGYYRLNFTVKNASPSAVATPSVELTLTDSRDQAVVRRVLQPREIGYNEDAIGPSGEWSASVPMGLELADAIKARVSGYRMLVFYP